MKSPNFKNTFYDRIFLPRVQHVCLPENIMYFVKVLKMADEGPILRTYIHSSHQIVMRPYFHDLFIFCLHRNLARETSLTSYTMVLDVDIILTDNAALLLRSFSLKSFVRNRMSLKRKIRNKRLILKLTLNSLLIKIFNPFTVHL